VVARHDRVFLDAVCTQLVDLDPARDGPVRYRGAYTQYLHAKRAERAATATVTAPAPLGSARVAAAGA